MIFFFTNKKFHFPIHSWTSGEFFAFVDNAIAVIRVPFLIAYQIERSGRMGCAQLYMVLNVLEILSCLLLENGHNVIKVIPFLLKSNTVKNEVGKTFSPKCDNLF